MRHIYTSLFILVMALLMPRFAFAQDSRHMLSGELGVGYSSLLSNSQLGKSNGLAGANLQLGYEWQYKRLLVHTGAELASVNSSVKLSDFNYNSTYSMGLSSPMTEHFYFSEFKEKEYLLQLNIPVMVLASRYMKIHMFQMSESLILSNC